MMKRFGIIIKAAAFVVVFLLIKFIIHSGNGEFITANAVLTALVAGVIFTIAIIFSGILSDYKESEKIPGELAASLRSLYNDVNLIQTKDEKKTNDLRSHIKDMLHIILANFEGNCWKLSKVNPALNHIADDVNELAKEGVPPPFIIKMRNELTIIDRISYRIETIMETSFIPAAYHIAIIATTAVLATLLFTKTDHWYDASLLLGSVSFVLISLLLLIKDMDNPFEYGKGSSADIDLSILFKLKDEFDNR
jgi:hypothetical protein